MALQVFEADGVELGSREVPGFRNVPGLPLKAVESQAYFCPLCEGGRIWGRLVVPGAAYTQCCYRPCRQHGNGRLSMNFPVPGEVNGIAADWPRQALLRELMIELEQIQ